MKSGIADGPRRSTETVLNEQSWHIATYYPGKNVILHILILTRRAGKGSEALPSLAGQSVGISFFGARVIFRWIPWLIYDSSGAAIGCCWTESAVRGLCGCLGRRGNRTEQRRDRAAERSHFGRRSGNSPNGLPAFQPLALLFFKVPSWIAMPCARRSGNPPDERRRSPGRGRP